MPRDGATGFSRCRSDQRHDPGVEVRQQPGLLEYPDGHGAHVGERVVVPVGVQPLPRRRPAVLGSVTQGEQRLLAAWAAPCRAISQDLVRGQVRRRYAVRNSGESAVVATVAAQTGQRDEHLARVGHRAGTSAGHHRGVANPRGRGAQALEVAAAGPEEHQRLRPVQRLAVPGPGQRPPHRVVSHRGRLCHRRGRRSGPGDVSQGHRGRDRRGRRLVALVLARSRRVRPGPAPAPRRHTSARRSRPARRCGRPRRSARRSRPGRRSRSAVCHRG